jgi:hypothetical protein
MTLQLKPNRSKFFSLVSMILLAVVLAKVVPVWGIEEKEGVAMATVEQARDRAKVLHETLHSTLKVIHRRYFHEDRAVIPARAMEDIFDEMKHEGHFEARWISVNLRAMGIDHEPATAFEKMAASELKGGKTEYETIEGDYYRRAATIPLKNGCIGCHEGGLRSSGSRDKFAALIISIKISEQSSNSDK